MDKKIVLSILIPTKNREKYAFNVIKQILSIPYYNYQLVIQDNSDTDLLKKKIEGIEEKDKRLNYYHEKRLLSFVENFNLGLEKCKGEYVTIIGDDDGINPDIFRITEWAINKNIDAITPSLSLIYFWPESGVNSVNKNGTLKINNFSSNIKYVKAKKELKKFLKNGCHNYLEYNLGKAYHGIVKKSILEKIKRKTSKYVGGLTPDVYLSVSISLIADTIAVIDYPFTISGICGRSGSSDSATGKHTGKLENAPHFRGHNNYQWSKLVPPFYSVETIWADSVLAAINDLEEISFLKYLDHNLLTIRCLSKYAKYNKIIINHFKKVSLTNDKKSINYLLLKSKFKVHFYNVNRLKQRILNKILRRNKQNSYHHIRNIEEASILSIDYINKSRKKLIQHINS